MDALVKDLSAQGTAGIILACVMVMSVGIGLTLKSAGTALFRYMFNAETRADGKAKGPIARALDFHFDQMGVIVEACTSMKNISVDIKNYIVAAIDRDGQVLTLLGIVESKLERLFETQSTIETKQYLVAIGEFLDEFAEQLGVKGLEKIKTRVDKMKAKIR